MARKLNDSYEKIDFTISLNSQIPQIFIKYDCQGCTNFYVRCPKAYIAMG